MRWPTKTEVCGRPPLFYLMVQSSSSARLKFWHAAMHEKDSREDRAE